MTIINYESYKEEQMKRRLLVLFCVLAIVTSNAFAFSNVYFRGTSNNWSATPMTNVMTNQWQTIQTFKSSDNERFKFDINGDWTHSYGDNNPGTSYVGGTAERSGADIKAMKDTTYKITFYENTLYYTAYEFTNVSISPSLNGQPAFRSLDLKDLTAKVYKNNELLMEDKIFIDSESHGSRFPRVRFAIQQPGSYTFKVDEVKDGKHYRGECSFDIDNDWDYVSLGTAECDITNEPAKCFPDQLYNTEAKVMRYDGSVYNTFYMTCQDGILVSNEIDFTAALGNEFIIDIYGCTSATCRSTSFGDYNLDNILDPGSSNSEIPVSSEKAIIKVNYFDKTYEVIPVNHWKRTIVMIYGRTVTGQDMFIRGGIDHEYSTNVRDIHCNEHNYKCAIPIRYLNNKNATTTEWKDGDNYLDWYGKEATQGTGSHGLAEGSALDWTSSNVNYGHDYDTVGYGYTPLNEWGDHYWMFEVEMDCSKTVDGWFEVKSYISNGPGWESNINQPGTPYESNNHFAKCGKMNVFNSSQDNVVVIKDIPACTLGMDWTCNDDPTISSIHGVCNQDNTCTCNHPSVINENTGKCT